MVNGEVITSSELRELTLPADKEREALEMLIEKRLIEQEANLLNIKVSEQEVDQAIEDIVRQRALTLSTLRMALAKEGVEFDEYQEQIRDQVLTSKLIRSRVQSQVEVSEEDIIDYYSRNPQLSQKGEEIRVQQILFLVSPTSDQREWEEAYQRAIKVHKRLKEGADFAVLAKKYSHDRAARGGGDLGWVRRGMLLPSFELTAFKLKVGEISEPVRTPLGFHIIKILDRRESEAEPFEKVKERIREHLTQERSERLFRQWLQRLKEGSLIERKL